jgi:translation initiation factor IF-3
MTSSALASSVPSKTPYASRASRLAAANNNAKEDKPIMNEAIQATQLRVVIPNPIAGKDQALGIMSRAEALAKAKSLGNLDLILINEKSDPPVCKIVDYSKFRYAQEKKAKEIKKMSKATEIKEVKMSYKIDVHDYEVRQKNAKRFLQQGNRVKCTVMFRGREVQHDQLGFELLLKLANDLDDVCQKEGRPKREGRNLSVILTPRPEVMKAVSESRKAGEQAKKKKKQQEKKELLVSRMTKNANGEIVPVEGIEDDDDSEDDDDDSDYDDDSDDEEDDVDASLDALLGKDDFTDKLFS